MGYTRILDVLRQLGITRISRQTVKAILKAQDIAPAPDRSGGTWTEFIRIYADTLWQCDFLTRPIWMPEGLVNLYLLSFSMSARVDCGCPQPLAPPTQPG